MPAHSFLTASLRIVLQIKQDAPDQLPHSPQIGAESDTVARTTFPFGGRALQVITAEPVAFSALTDSLAVFTL